TILLNTLGFAPSGTGRCIPDLTNVHILFAVSTNVDRSPNGGTVLLDNIQFTPVPARQITDPKALSLSVSGQTFGVLPAQRLPIPTDQVNRNLATVRDAAMTIVALFKRGQSQDIVNAL